MYRPHWDLPECRATALGNSTPRGTSETASRTKDVREEKEALLKRFACIHGIHTDISRFIHEFEGGKLDEGCGDSINGPTAGSEGGMLHASDEPGADMDIVGHQSQEQYEASRRLVFGTAPMCILMVFRRVIMSLIDRAVREFTSRESRKPENGDELLTPDWPVHRNLCLGVGRNTTKGRFLFPYAGIEAEILYHSSTSLWIQHYIDVFECPVHVRTVRAGEIRNVIGGDYYFFNYGKIKKWLQKTNSLIPNAWAEEESRFVKVDDKREYQRGDVVVYRHMPHIVKSSRDGKAPCFIHPLGPRFYRAKEIEVSNGELAPFTTKYFQARMKKASTKCEDYWALLHAKNITDSVDIFAQPSNNDVRRTLYDTNWNRHDENIEQIDKEYADALRDAKATVVEKLENDLQTAPST